VSVMGASSTWNVQSCTQMCSPYPELNDVYQLKASNKGRDLSLFEYFGPYPSSFQYDVLVFESLHVTECVVNGKCHSYSNYLGNLRFSEDDHRYDVRLSRCYSSRDVEIHIQIGGLTCVNGLPCINPRIVNVEGCFLSVVINRNPYLHAYLMNLTLPQDTSVNIAQIMLGQYFLCAVQTVNILQQLGYGNPSIATALAVVYNLGDIQTAATLRCAQVCALDTTLVLQNVYLDNSQRATIALEYAGYAPADVIAAVDEVYGR